MKRYSENATKSLFTERWRLSVIDRGRLRGFSKYCWSEFALAVRVMAVQKMFSLPTATEDIQQQLLKSQFPSNYPTTGPQTLPGSTLNLPAPPIWGWDKRREDSQHSRRAPRCSCQLAGSKYSENIFFGDTSSGTLLHMAFSLVSHNVWVKRVRTIQDGDERCLKIRRGSWKWTCSWWGAIEIKSQPGCSQPFEGRSDGIGSWRQA